MEIINLPIADLIPAEYNPRKISKKQKDQIRKSLEEFSTVQPAVINSYPGRENVIISGHQRIIVSTEMGETSYPCIMVSLPLDKEKRLNLKLNKVSADWDSQALALNFDRDLLEDCGFSAFELNLQLASVSHKIGAQLEESPVSSSEDTVQSQSEPYRAPAEMKAVSTSPVQNTPRNYVIPIVLDSEEYGEWCRLKEHFGLSGDKALLLRLTRDVAI